MVYPLPAVYVTPLPVITAPSSRSPDAVVVATLLLADVPFPWAAEVAGRSKEFVVAKPEYSRMAKRNVLFEIDSDTVTVFAPPPMFSA